MARPLRIQFPGAFYHVTCRGIERRSIYGDDADRRKFVEQLSRSLAAYQVVLYGYILMDNHFHLLIQTRKANCSEFMRHFNICYTAWFNWRHQRCGNLYQGRYHALLIDADRYLLEVSRYLHLNSVRKTDRHRMRYRELWRCAADYPWSSLKGYLDERKAARWIDYDLTLSMIGGRKAYASFLVDGLMRGLDSPFEKVTRRFILGDDEFAADVKRHLKRGSDREQPAYHEMLTTVLEPEALLGILDRDFGISREHLGQRRAHGLSRGMAAELLYKYCQMTQTEIGALLGGIDYVSVHMLRRRARQKMSGDKQAQKKYIAIEAKLDNTCNM